MSKFLDHMSEFLAHRKGFLPITGILLIIGNLIIQFILPGKKAKMPGMLFVFQGWSVLEEQIKRLRTQQQWMS